MRLLHDRWYFRQYLLQIHLHGMWGVFLNEFFRRMATSLIGLYIPIFLWQELGSLWMVPMYWLVYSLSGLVVMYPGAKVIQKIGLDKSMLIGCVLRGVFIFSLILVPEYNFMAVVSAVFFGFAQPFDWLPFHYVVIKESGSDGKMGSSASYASLVTQLAGAVGPAVGGMIIVWWGYTILYMIAGFLLVLAAGMAFLDDFEKKGMHVSGKEAALRFFDWGIVKHVAAYGLQALDSWVYLIVWPIFLFEYVGEISGSGMFQTVSLLLSCVVVYAVGKLVDKKNFKMIKIGAVMLWISWGFRAVTRVDWGLLLVQIADNLGVQMVWTPVAAMSYFKAEKHYTMEFLLVREVLIKFLQTVTVLPLLGALVIGVSFELIFMMMGVLSLFAMTFPYLYDDYIKEM